MVYTFVTIDSYGQTLQLTPAQIMAVDSTDYFANLNIKRTYDNYRDEVKVDYHFGGGYLSMMRGWLLPPDFTISYIGSTAYHYYLRDYQGNNRVVVALDGTVEQQNDYYAYGGPWGDTSTNQGLQPFKYNGKELDRIHGLDWYDYGARRYDPAFAQFTQMDPLSEKYPHLSPYAYCAGNPVNYVDPDGQRIWILSDRKKYMYEDGNVYDNNVSMDYVALPSYVQNVVAAFEELCISKIGHDLISELQNSSNDFLIQNGYENGFKHSRLSSAIANNPEIFQNKGAIIDVSGSGGIITWNPSIKHGGMQSNHSSERPPYIGLGHELFHAHDANNGILYPNNDLRDDISGVKYRGQYKGLDKAEWRAVHGENLIRQELKLPLRVYYESVPPYGHKLVTKKNFLFNYPK